MSQVEYDVDQDEDKEGKETEYVAVEDDPNEDVEGESEDDVDDEDEGDDELDSRAAGNVDDDDDAEDGTKKQRREENKNRRQRQREARERNERELNFLRSRNAKLEQRFSEFEVEVDARVTGSELSSIDQQINKAQSDLRLADQVIEQAIEANDGKGAAQALNHRDAIRDSLRDLESTKEYLVQERPQPQREVDPRHKAHAEAFMRDNDWWDPRGVDDDSQAVLMIDRSLVQEGYNPTSKEYWDELRTRVQTQLPARFETGDEDDDASPGGGRAKNKVPKQKRRKEGPEFRTGGRERPLKKNEVYISAERREAMEEAGVWEDKKLRNQYLKAYAEYDRNAEGGGA